MLSRRDFAKAAFGAFASSAVGLDLSTFRGVANASSYADTENHWVNNDGILDFVTNRDILSGSDGSFRPDEQVNRATAAIVAFRAGAGATSETPIADENTTGLSDVEDGAYYTLAVNWAIDNHVMNGYRNPDGSYTTFGPFDLVEREQFAVIMYNIATKVFGRSYGDCSSSLVAFGDSGSVSSWARQSVGWCIRAGAISGNNGFIKPSDPITRAEVAKIVMKAILYADPQRKYSNLILTPSLDNADYIGCCLSDNSVSYYKLPYDSIRALSLSANEESVILLDGSLESSYGSMSLQTIFGEDDRIKVEEITEFPYRCISFVSAASGSDGSIGSSFVCSKTMALTAAHCVFDKDKQQFDDTVQISPGCSDDKIYPYYRAKYTYVPKRYYCGATDMEFDYGVIAFEHNKMIASGSYLGVGAISDPRGHCYDIVGYPGDKYRETNAPSMWRASGSISKFGTGCFSTTVDVVKGSSGSAVLTQYSDYGNLYAIGLANFESSTNNYGRLVDFPILYLVRSFRVNGETTAIVSQ